MMSIRSRVLTFDDVFIGTYRAYKGISFPSSRCIPRLLILPSYRRIRLLNNEV